MKSCFGYIRVSTQKQGEGVSLEAQREAIERFAARNDIVIADWFEEKQTAAKQGRPIFTAMVRDLKRGKAAGVVMHKIDRSARNFRDWAQIGDLADAGISVHFATEAMDFQSRGGRLSADIQAVIAADYIRNLREETLKGMKGRLQQGFYPFNAPIGYVDNGGGKLKTHDPVQAPLVRKTFELYASGRHSFRSLQKEMAARGLRGRKGSVVTKQGIEKLLRNPFYTGLMKLKSTGDIYHGKHKPIVTQQLFDAVQAVRANRTGKKVTKHDHTYRGLFRCGLCNAAMIAERQKGHCYYRCQTKHCRTKTVREEDIETAVQNILGLQRMDEQQLGSFKLRFRDWLRKRRNPQANILNLKRLLVELEQKEDRLTDALLDQTIDKATYQKKKEALLMEQNRVTDDLQRVEQLADKPRLVDAFPDLANNLAQQYILAESPEKREIVQMATSNRIVVGKMPVLEPSNWLGVFQTVAAVYTGDPHRTTSRTFISDSDNSSMGDILGFVNSPDFEGTQSALNSLHSRLSQKTAV